MLTRRSTRCPSRTTRTTPSWPTRCSTTPAGRTTATASADQGRRGALVRPLRALGVAVGHPDAKLIAEQAAEIGVEFNVQVVSTDKLTELTVQQGRRQAGAGVRHLHLGLGRRPLRPELPAQPVHHRRDRRLLGRLLLEPRVRPAVRGAGRRVRRRGAQGDDPGDGRDRRRRTCPYVVLTEDPQPGGLPHRRARQRRARSARPRPAIRSASRSPTSRCCRSRPRRARGWRRRWRRRAVIAVIARGGRRRPRSSSSAPGAGVRASRWSSRREARAIGRLRDEARSVNARWLAGKVGAALLTLVFVLDLQLLPLPGDGRPDHPARAAAAVDPGGDRAAAGRLRARQAAARPVRRLRRRHAATFDLGISQRTREPVWDEIKDAMPWTLLLVGTGTLLATMIGSLDGGGRRDQARARRPTTGLLGFSLFTYSAPEYWIGIILILVFAVGDPDIPGRAAGDARGRSSRAGSPRRSTSPTT